MSEQVGKVRRFSPGAIDKWQKMGDQNIHLGHAIEKREGGPLSAYYARFGKGERAPLPAPYAEVWVILQGRLTIQNGDATLSATTGDILHIPTQSPGMVLAEEDTELASVSVPAH